MALGVSNHVWIPPLITMEPHALAPGSTYENTTDWPAGNVSPGVADQLCPSGCLHNSTCPAPSDCEPKAPFFMQQPIGHKTDRWHYEPLTRLAIVLGGVGRWENQHGP